ncbi:P27 family phage terminase small subunit [Bacillus mycoides]|uniref:P27 family phage terminase small subunit n=1 Tax=Bacillus mycoides TaxID=1405 RepID=UPI001C02D433|nr:P27 family phage terminase small subunit [Bacillus mycoides]QWH77289.1 RNA polymerase subunit sigma-70 [Bacillus mycoides]QWI42338.1 RNA polymerase subunit sigma-70 [Bacillus mycoides]
MNNNATLHELAYNEYSSGMKYKDIAQKHGVSINTVKSWKQRHKWKRGDAPKNEKVAPQQKMVQQKEKNNKLRTLIKNDLMNQLKVNKTSGAQYTDLVADYMALWDIKNNLISDIEERGVVVEWSNGKQKGKKKNESIQELNKTNAQMLKLLEALGLKATEIEVQDDDVPDL